MKTSTTECGEGYCVIVSPLFEDYNKTVESSSWSAYAGEVVIDGLSRDEMLDLVSFLDSVKSRSPSDILTILQGKNEEDIRDVDRVINKWRRWLFAVELKLDARDSDHVLDTTKMPSGINWEVLYINYEGWYEQLDSDFRTSAYRLAGYNKIQSLLSKFNKPIKGLEDKESVETKIISELEERVEWFAKEKELDPSLLRINLSTARGSVKDLILEVCKENNIDFFERRTSTGDFEILLDICETIERMRNERN